MVHILLGAGWIVISLLKAKASNSPPQDNLDNVMIMLSVGVKSFHKALAESPEIHVRETPSLLQQPQLPLVAFNVTSNHTSDYNTTSSVAWYEAKVHTMQTDWLHALGVSLLGCAFCVYCCGLWQRGRAREKEEEPFDTWERQDDRTPAERLRAMFLELDDVVEQSLGSPSGYLTLAGLFKACQDKRVKRELRLLRIPERECSNIFRSLDTDNDGYVCVEAFLDECLARDFLSRENCAPLSPAAKVISPRRQQSYTT